jgi:hypothetical protein
MTDKNKEKPREQMTDVELSKKLSDDVHESYLEALDFVETSPKHSLIEFRKVLECVIEVIANKHKLSDEIKGESLNDKIEYLVDCGITGHQLKLNILKVKKLGNKASHVTFNKENSNSDEKYSNSNEKYSNFKKEALDIRETVISIFEDVHKIIHDVYPSLLEDRYSLGHNREIIHRALISTDYKEKLKAGIVCESMFKEQLNSSETNEASGLEYHLEMLKNSTLVFYEAAYKISAQVDNNPYSSDKEKEKEVFEKCELEPLYKYAYFGLTDDNDKNYEKFKKALQVAADRKYAPAEALLGAVFYDKNNFEKAFKYLSRAERKKECLALRFFYYYYTEGLASVKITPNKALKYLDRAIVLEDPDSFATKGEACYEGRHLPKDDKQAIELLKKSVELGSAFGKGILDEILIKMKKS